MKKLEKQSQQTIQEKQRQTDSETFICQSCDTSEVFSKKDVLKKKKVDPELAMQGFSYYIPCPFCYDGYMLSQLDLVFHQFAADLFNF